jgi:hypothetical protein
MFKVAALQAWVAGGGLLVCAGPRLARDERFRPWLPARWGQSRMNGPDLLAARYRTGRTRIAYTPLTPVPDRAPRSFLGRGAESLALSARWGQGTVIALGFDPATTAFANWPGRESLWRDVAAQGIRVPSITQTVQAAEANRVWNGGGSGSFAASVLRAPGLSAPAFGYIGAFLFAYLLLLVPVNYLVLKRMDRRELTWLTVPLLVALFSGLAYGFGYRLKGGDLRLNTASIIEMGAGNGQASVATSAGIFSPRRTSYDIAVADREALLFDPTLWDGNGGNAGQNYAPLFVSQEMNEAQTRDTDISMWAMRVVGARTNTQMGNGVDARLRIENDDVVGTITNRTGAPSTMSAFCWAACANPLAGSRIASAARSVGGRRPIPE